MSFYEEIYLIDLVFQLFLSSLQKNTNGTKVGLLLEMFRYFCKNQRQFNKMLHPDVTNFSHFFLGKA